MPKHWGQIHDDIDNLADLIGALELAISGTEVMDADDHNALRQLARSCGLWLKQTQADIKATVAASRQEAA